MSQGETTAGSAASAAISEDALKKAEEFIEADEGALNRLTGFAGTAVTTIAVVMSLFHLYAAIAGAWPLRDAPIIPTQPLRYVHVAFVLLLSFLLFPMATRFRNQIRWWDVLLGVAGAGILVYAINGGDDFTDRASLPNRTDVAVGVVFILLVLEATRRTSGWIMPAVGIGFIVYAMTGPYLPPPWTHRGYGIDRLVGHLYMTLEGIFGSAVDVSSSLIVLFTIFGAVLSALDSGSTPRHASRTRASRA